MVIDELSGTAELLGEDAIVKLSKARVAVFGLGGAGSCAAEALVRSGIGAIDLIDGSMIETSDINRHPAALKTTVGMLKIDVLAERFLKINPELNLRTFRFQYNEYSAGEFDFTQYDYVIDAMSGVSAKVHLAEMCHELKTRSISFMGAKNKLNPMGFQAGDIFSASVCPEARVIRHELRSRGVDRLKIVYSKEPPASGSAFASCAFVYAAAGTLLASETVMDLIS